VRVRAFLANLGLVLGSVAVTLLVVEIALRVIPLDIVPSASTDRGYFSKFDPKLGWAPIPDARGYHSDHGFSVLVEQNSLGLRAPEEVGPQRLDEDYRVLVLGDSYVWGYGVDQDEIFTNPKVHGREGLEFVNMGVSGYGTDQALLLYRSLGSTFDADAVVLVFTTYNDVANNVSPLAYGYSKPYFTLLDGRLTLHDGHVRDSMVRKLWNGFIDSSRTASLLNTGIINLDYMMSRPDSREEALADAIDRVRSPGELSARDKLGLDLTVALITQLRDEVESRGNPFKVVFVPYKPHIVALQEHDHPLVEPLSRQLAEKGIATASPYGLFLAEARNGTNLFNGEDNHFNAAGHKLFGRFLAGQFAGD
jgi:hypothetical protein